MSRRRPVWLGIVAVVAALSVIALLSTRAGDTGADPNALAPVKQGSAAPLPPDADPAPPGDGSGLYPVDQFELTITDPVLDDRDVDLVVWAPRGSGSFQLAVFAHGFATPPETYGDFLSQVAAHGFVVVAPRSLPTRLTAFRAQEDDRGVGDPGPGIPVAGVPDAGDPESGDPESDDPESGDPESGDFGAGVVFDFNDQRLDIIATIDVMLGPDAPPEVRGRVANTEVGVIGHSDGGVTAAAVAFNSQAGDPRIGGAVIISGSYGYFDGEWFADGAPALLAIHGDSDTVNPIESSVAIYSADRGGPRYLVVAHGAGHINLLLDDPPRIEIGRMVADFLAAYARHDPDAGARVGADSDGTILDLVADG